jgi:acetyl-CoA synthetase
VTRPETSRSYASGDAAADAVQERVSELLSGYTAKTASAAWLLCDRHDPDVVAVTIVDGDATDAVTYGELRRRSERVASALRSLGVRPGDRVATLLGKGPHLIPILLGIWRVGAVYTPLFTAFAAAAADYRLRAAGVTVVFTDAAQRAKLDGDTPAPWQVVTVGEGVRDGDFSFADLVATAPEDDVPAFVQGGAGPLVHMFTSGTTGSPKGVIHPLAYAAGWESYLEFGLGVTADDVYWCAADPGWAYGLYAAIVAPLSAGTGTILTVGGFNASATWGVIDRLGVTNFTAAPTVYRALKNAPREGAGTLRRLSSAGEPLTPEINDWSARELGLEVRDHFGQTEVGMVFANHHHPALRRDIVPGSMGRPLPGWSAAVLAEDGTQEVPAGEVGRIVIDVSKSAFMTFENYQDPTKTASRFAGDGRFYILGDLGSMDEDGNLRFSARDDDVIIMAGYRIGPFEVESAISRHPAVAECAVIAAPDEARGEVVEAYVVVRDGYAADDSTAQEIATTVRTTYAAHAYPRAVHFVDSLPKTPSGKIQRFVLREARRAEIDTKRADA